MSDIYGIIYKATNLINNKMYIGQTTQDLQRRITQHICEIDAGSKLVFHRAIYKNGVEAARAVNKKGSSPISRCCKGKQQTAYGYKWMYEKDLKNK
ncbi:GIY-YIG nuclease family protein [Anoxybacillus flavithermus]|uniref:GIY-YIG nuclease family protein n=1 Tax=Anoxybacillus flavithermus TaxID=33934 RepID=UPI0007D9F6ED|nr:GIY-YIG nuclease family protein [Anoxybacillus flavithermus]